VKGGPYRIYFSGYQWKPGIRPHNEPTIEEMRQAYRGKAETGQAKSWTSVTVDIPATTASELSMQHLGKVRYITLYFWFAKDGYVDDVAITKISGP